MMQEDRYIRIKELSTILGIGKSTIYRLVKDGKFPKQIKLTERTAVWKLSVINAWIKDKESQT